jgi:hypothetical protein
MLMVGVWSVTIMQTTATVHMACGIRKG